MITNANKNKLKHAEIFKEHGKAKELKLRRAVK